MNSDKAIYYYFCLTVAVIMILLAITLCIFQLALGFDPEGIAIMKKCGIFGAAFLVPPILYKIFATKEQESKNKKPFTIYYLIYGLVCAAIIGVASGFLKAGMTKIALWLYMASAIPGFMIFLPMYYAIFEHFNDDNNEDNNDND